MDNGTNLSLVKKMCTELTTLGFTAEHFDIVMDNGVAKVGLTAEGLVNFWKRSGTPRARKALRLYNRTLKDMERAGHPSEYAECLAIDYALRAIGLTEDELG